ncbi:MAG TPA: hypothetical protein VIB82_02800, partial [Caulobacteraceae bacterium]
MRTAILVCVALAAGSAAAKPAFAPARSAAEQALDRILKLDAQKPEMMDPAIEVAGRRPRTTPPPGAPYLRYLTTPLAAAILAEEARQVKANCGGVSKRGEECGMDSDPVLCAQDFPDHYLFRTIQSGPALAVAETAWPPDKGAQPK